MSINSAFPLNDLSSPIKSIGGGEEGTTFGGLATDLIGGSFHFSSKTLRFLLALQQYHFLVASSHFAPSNDASSLFTTGTSR
jgi:hypothetical protein